MMHAKICIQVPICTDTNICKHAFRLVAVVVFHDEL